MGEVVGKHLVIRVRENELYKMILIYAELLQVSQSLYSAYSCVPTLLKLPGYAKLAGSGAGFCYAIVEEADEETATTP